MAEGSWDHNEKENFIQPFMLIQVDKVEGKEQVCCYEKYKHPVFVHGLTEGVANTEGYTRHAELED